MQEAFYYKIIKTAARKAVEKNKKDKDTFYNAVFPEKEEKHANRNNSTAIEIQR